MPNQNKGTKKHDDMPFFFYEKHEFICEEKLRYKEKNGPLLGQQKYQKKSETKHHKQGNKTFEIIILNLQNLRVNICSPRPS